MSKRTNSDSPDKTCTADGCHRPLRARGLCSSHYNAAHYPDRHAKKLTPCAWCGAEVMKNSGGNKARRPACSNECRQWLATPYSVLPADHWVRMLGKASNWPRGTGEWIERSRSPLALAIRDNDYAEILRVIELGSVLTDAGCWEWQRRMSDGYPQVRFSVDGKKKNFQVHRLALEAKHGKPLGSQAAHHVCANTRCVNPCHLQPVSHRENSAEMLERNYYIARIEELELALAASSPTHPLLSHISTPKTA